VTTLGYTSIKLQLGISYRVQLNRVAVREKTATQTVEQHRLLILIYVQVIL